MKYLHVLYRVPWAYGVSMALHCLVLFLLSHAPSQKKMPKLVFNEVEDFLAVEIDVLDLSSAPVPVHRGLKAENSKHEPTARLKARETYPKPAGRPRKLEVKEGKEQKSTVKPNTEIEPEPALQQSAPKIAEQIADQEDPLQAKSPIREPQVFDAGKVERSKSFNQALHSLKQYDTSHTPEPAKLPVKSSIPQETISGSQAEASKNALLAQHVQRHIMRCWSIPATIKAEEYTTVTVKLQLDRGGQVVELSTVDGEPGDPIYEALEQSAVRAVRRCTPLEGLPPEKYQLWSKMEIIFDPSTRLGH